MSGGAGVMEKGTEGAEIMKSQVKSQVNSFSLVRSEFGKGVYCLCRNGAL